MNNTAMRNLFAPGAVNLWAIVLAVGVTTVTCLASGAVKTISGQIAPIWLTNGVLLAQVLVAHEGRRYFVLAGGALGNLAANLIVGESLGVSVAYSSADMLEVVMGAMFVPSITAAAEMIRPRWLFTFVPTAVVLAPIASGGVATFLLRHELSGGAFLPTFANWFVSDALGIAIFTPAASVFWTGEVAILLSADHRKKTFFLLSLVCIVTVAVFGQNRFPIMYWALPPLVLLAFQADLAGMLVGLLLCLGIALAFTMRGFGPLWTYQYAGMEGRILALQLFLVAALGMTFPINAAQAHRSRLLKLLLESEYRYRGLAEHSNDIVTSMTLDGRRTYVSPRCEAVLGYSPSELTGRYDVDLAHPDDCPQFKSAFDELAAGSSEASVVVRLRHKCGHFRWTSISMHVVQDPVTGRPDTLAATVRDITRWKHEQQSLVSEHVELRRLAFQDGLTGLSNRRHFDAELERIWNHAESRDAIAVLMVDVDDFKSFNDSYGHLAGDACLQRVAGAIAEVRRDFDVAARYGGEEFALVLTQIDASGAQQVAERIRRSVEALHIPHQGSPFGVVTASIGIAVGAGQQHANDVVAAADTALYAAKRDGRNRIRLATAIQSVPG
jgi:diguanylate cyclase (GGDEF)-like protein/PAS domain S-box-containing protein